MLRVVAHLEASSRLRYRRHDFDVAWVTTPGILVRDADVLQATEGQSHHLG